MDVRNDNAEQWKKLARFGLGRFVAVGDEAVMSDQ